MPFFDEIVTIGTKETMHLFLNKQEILSTKHFLKHSFDQIDKSFEKYLILKIRSFSIFLQAFSIEPDNNLGITITYLSLEFT